MSVCLSVCLSVQANQKIARFIHSNLLIQRYLTTFRKVIDDGESESEVRSLVSISTMVLWKTRGFERNYGFSIRVDWRVFAVEELESDIGFSLVWTTRRLFKKSFQNVICRSRTLFRQLLTKLKWCSSDNRFFTIWIFRSKGY